MRGRLLASIGVGAAIALGAAVASADGTRVTPHDDIWTIAKRVGPKEDVARLEQARRDAIPRLVVAGAWEQLEGDAAVGLQLAYRRALQVAASEGDFAGALRGRARSALIGLGAAESTDPRVLFALARSYGTATIEDCTSAVVYFHKAIAGAPKSLFAASAWNDIATCQWKLGDHVAVVEAYEHALEVETRPGYRATTWANLAEARMSLGRMAEALDAVEIASAMDPGQPVHQWTLAVIRDRSGDAFGALVAAKHAVEGDPYDANTDTYAELDGHDVTFDPPYERFWYHALGHLARADDAGADVVARRRELEAARKDLDGYVAAADAKDRWKATAEERAKRVAGEIARLPKPTTTPPAKARPAAK